MAQDTQDRRSKLRQTIIGIAARTVAEHGLQALKVRDLATQAGCSLGAVYNVFADLDDVAMEVNRLTFRRLAAFVFAQIGNLDTLPPRDALISIGKAYAAFARENRLSWAAMFDISLTDSDDVPNWYRAELGRLFHLIAEPAARLRPDLSPADLELAARALFSAVHGIVLLSLENRMSGVPEADVDRMIDLLIGDFGKK